MPLLRRGDRVWLVRHRCFASLEQIDLLRLLIDGAQRKPAGECGNINAAQRGANRLLHGSSKLARELERARAEKMKRDMEGLRIETDEKR